MRYCNSVGHLGHFVRKPKKEGMEMNPITYYLRSLNKKSHGYRPTWLPSVPIQLGDVGILEDDVFQKESSLESLGIDFETATSENDSTVDLSSESGITLTTKLEGKVEPKATSLGVADAGFIVEFGNQNGYVFKLKGSKTRIISNLGAVKAEILSRYNQGNWDPKLVVINEILEAKSATILLSGHAGNKVELKAQCDASVASMDIADAALNLKLESGQTLAAQIIGQQGVKPLYRVIGLKKRLFSTSFGSKGEAAAPQEPEEEMEVAEIEMESLPAE
jgi:hypothetical protein